MTPGNNGASTPEDDDPFGYLYADGQANGAQPPTGGYGYPGSVNRVRTVGERQYGQPQAPTAAYGQVPQQQGYGQTAPYGQPNAHYAAPETMPGGAPAMRQAPMGAGGGRGGGPNTRGLLIGAIAVVAAVVIGIAVAMMNGDSNDGKNNAGASSSPSVAQSASPSQSATQPSTEATPLPTIDAKALRLTGTTTASDVKGAKADGGVYVAGFNTVGAAATWSVNVPSTGKYTLHSGYGVPGVDATATLTVNGTAQTTPLAFKNWANAPQGAWEKGWTKTYNYVQLNQGTNTITISCQQGNQCNFYLDQLWLTNGWSN